MNDGINIYYTLNFKNTEIMPTILPDQNVKKVAVASKSQFIDAYTSHKLAVLSFICSLAVILLHSYNWRFNADSNLTVDFFIENTVIP